MLHSRPKSIGELPHLLFFGPPGTGKTSTVLAMARDLFGPQLYRSRILELNASDERGIAVIREKVKQFAKTTAKETAPGYPCPPFKLIILDEADSLTSDAQTALRRIIEIHSRGTRFCLICNYVSRIIAPLASRCAKFRFRPIEQPAGMAKLQEIVQAERVQLAEEGEKDQAMQKAKSPVLDAILHLSSGDLRRAITLLQCAHRLGEPITLKLVADLAAVLPPSLIQQGYELCQMPSCTPDSIGRFVRQLILHQGHSSQQFVIQFAEQLFADPAISSVKKALISLRISQFDHLLHDGADELLQLLSFMTFASGILSNRDPTTRISALV